MMYPICHLNGTSRDTLVHDLCAASNAVWTARQFMAMAYPHPRDYTNRPDASFFKQAEAEHADRIKRIETLYNELRELAMLIDDNNPLNK